MFDTVLLVILFVALIALDLLALEFGADSRKPIDPWATFMP
jgi:hypothetical protein